MELSDIGDIFPQVEPARKWEDDFILACKQGDREVIQKFVKNGVEISAELGSRAMSAALGAPNFIEIVNFLITCKINPPNLFQARSASMEAFKFVIESGFHDKNKSFPSPIKYLINTGQPTDIEMIKELIKQGANLHAESDFGLKYYSNIFRSPNSTLEILKFLLDNGCDKKEMGMDTLYLPGVKKLQFILEYGVEIPADILIRATKYSYLEVVKILVDNGANINYRDFEGHTPLFYAAQYRKYKIVRFLLSKGADPNITSRRGNKSPLHMAIISGKAEIVRDLVVYGADTHAVYSCSKRKNRQKRTIPIEEMKNAGEIRIKEALICCWSPACHHLFPQPIKDAIFCVLLIAKRQHWAFDSELMNTILGFIPHNFMTTRL